MSHPLTRSTEHAVHDILPEPEVHRLCADHIAECGNDVDGLVADSLGCCRRVTKFVVCQERAQLLRWLSLGHIPKDKLEPRLVVLVAPLVSRKRRHLDAIVANLICDSNHCFFTGGGEDSKREKMTPQAQQSGEFCFPRCHIDLSRRIYPVYSSRRHDLESWCTRCGGDGALCNGVENSGDPVSRISHFMHVRDQSEEYRQIERGQDWRTIKGDHRPRVRKTDLQEESVQPPFKLWSSHELLPGQFLPRLQLPDEVACLVQRRNWVKRWRAVGGQTLEVEVFGDIRLWWHQDIFGLELLMRFEFVSVQQDVQADIRVSWLL